MSKCQCKNVTNQWSSESNQSEEEQFVFGTLNYEHPVVDFSLSQTNVIKQNL